MKNGHIKTYIYIGLVSVLAIISAACGTSAKTANANANSNANTAPTTVDTKTVQAVVQNVPTYFEATGNLTSDAQTDVAPTVAGKITEVNFDIGSYVQKGAVMVRLDSRDAQIRLEQAQAQVAQSQSNIAQAQSQVEQARANVKQVQSQLGLQDGATFSIANVAEVKTAKAALELAEKELTRATRLLETGDIARTIYDQRKTQYDQAKAQYDTAVNGANQRYAAIETAQAQVNTAQSGVKTAQSARDAALTQVDSAKKAIGDTVVYAPISGYISERVADLGEYISPSTPNSKIATILRTSVLRLRIDIPEQAVSQVKIGQSISLQTTAYPDRNFGGIVTRIAPNLNATSRTLIVEAEVENTQGLLKPGQFATVRITQSATKPTVVVPTTAVKTDGDLNKIYVIKDGRAEERTVKLGVLENDRIEVQQGIQEGEMVAVSNVAQLNDGVMVRQ